MLRDFITFSASLKTERSTKLCVTIQYIGHFSKYNLPSINSFFKHSEVLLKTFLWDFGHSFPV